jgi:peptidyl-tRNA hydrolase
MVDVKYKQYIIVIKPIVNQVSRSKFGVHSAHCSLTASLVAWIQFKDRFDMWFKGGDLQTKIIKEVKTITKLENIIKKASEKNVPYSMIADAGFTSELERGEFIMGCIGPITEEEARELGIWRLSNYTSKTKFWKCDPFSIKKWESIELLTKANSREEAIEKFESYINAHYRIRFEFERWHNIREVNLDEVIEFKYIE